MLRELAGMSAEEAYEWAQDRRAEAIRAYSLGLISQWVLDSVLEWAEDAYTDYLLAAGMGLIPPGQVAGEGRPE